jgi:hypothetical protein
MRMLFAALGLAAIVVQAAAAAPRPQTVFRSPSGQIDAFAQDGSMLAWFAHGSKGCNTVWVFDLATAEQVLLPAQGTRTVNVTCDWNVRPPVRLAVDFKTTTAIWTLRERAPLRFDYLIGASFTNRLERRFQEIAHASRGAGLWLGGVAGDDGTLVYSVTSVDFADEVGCLSNPKAPHACAMKVGNHGGVYRILGRKTPRLIPGTTPGAMQVAVYKGEVAYVTTATLARDGRPVADAASPVTIRSVIDGALVSRLAPHGTPEALALSSRVLAALERTGGKLRLAWYNPASGRPLGSVAVPATTSPEISASGRLIVFHAGRTIHAVEIATRKARVVVRAAATPIGLSIEGSRLAWAENVGGKGRVQALQIR